MGVELAPGRKMVSGGHTPLSPIDGLLLIPVQKDQFIKLLSIIKAYLRRCEIDPWR